MQIATCPHCRAEMECASGFAVGESVGCLDCGRPFAVGVRPPPPVPKRRPAPARSAPAHCRPVPVAAARPGSSGQRITALLIMFGLGGFGLLLAFVSPILTLGCWFLALLFLIAACQS